MCIKLYCVFLISVIALNCETNANGLPKRVKIQLHYIVSIFEKWVDDNTEVDSIDFKQYLTNFGVYILHILSVMPGHGHLCLWQLSILSNLIHHYHEFTYRTTDSKESVTWKVNSRAVQVLKMIQYQLTPFDQQKGLFSRFKKSAPKKKITSELLATIPTELNILQQIIAEDMAFNSDEMVIDMSVFHPKNLYLCHITWNASSMSLLVSNNPIASWDISEFQKHFTASYNAAMCEFANTDEQFKKLEEFWNFVINKTIRLSFLGLLSVHIGTFFLYRNFLNYSARLHHGQMWNSVITKTLEFIQFFKLKDDDNICQIYNELGSVDDSNEEFILEILYEKTNSIIYKYLDNSDNSFDLNKRGLGIMNMLVEATKPNYENLMKIAEANHKKLQNYLQEIYKLFKGVHFNTARYFSQIEF